MQHDVRERGGDGLAAVQLAGGALDHVGRHLDGASVQIEEAKAVAATRPQEGRRLADQLDARGAQPLGHGVDAGLVGSRKGDDVEPPLGRLAQANHEGFGRALRAKIGEVRTAVGLLQAPGAAHELAFGLELGDRQPHVAQGGDAAGSHCNPPAFPPDAPASAIDRRSGPAGKSQFGIPVIRIGYRGGAR